MTTTDHPRPTLFVADETHRFVTAKLRAELAEMVRRLRRALVAAARSFAAMLAALKWHRHRVLELTTAVPSSMALSDRRWLRAYRRSLHNQQAGPRRRRHGRQTR